MELQLHMRSAYESVLRLIALRRGCNSLHLSNISSRILQITIIRIYHMKLLLYIIPLLMVSFAAHIPSSGTIKEVAFTSGTRGYSESIRITPDSVIIRKEERSGTNSKSNAVSKEQWKKIVDSLQDVPLEEISSMPAPSQDHARDAAMHSQITISTGTKTYTSKSFDDHKPPKPLMPLMQQIDKLSKGK